MKKIKQLLLFVFLFSSQIIFSQQIGIGTNAPDTSAVLDIQSTTAGLLIPRMTSMQRTNIYLPKAGLLVFDLSTNSFWFYNGTSWSDLSSNGSTLNNSYNEGGAGLGRKINATDSAVQINGTDGLYVTGAFGQGTDVEIESYGTRMFFNPKKAAFRAGHLSIFNYRYWDTDSIGDYSFASGNGTRAVGNYSTAMGYLTRASGSVSTALGYQTKASGFYSTSIGFSTEASGNYATALGRNSIASGENTTTLGHFTRATGDYATALGDNTIASGDYATAFGRASEAFGEVATSFGLFTDADGNYSTAFGSYTDASGDNSAAFGNNTYAAGDYSTAMGRYTKSNGYASTVIGQYNDTVIGLQTSINNQTPLFIVGNGSNSANLSNAFVVRNNGSVNINNQYDLPTLDGTTNQIIKTDGSGVLSFVDATDVFNSTDNQNLTLSNDTLFIENGNYVNLNSNTDTANTLNQAYNKGGAGFGRKINATDSAVIIEGTDGLYVSGTFGQGTDVEIEGAGTRMFFNPKKGAFRAGTITNNNWDNDSIGLHSFAAGHNAKANGYESFAIGYFCEANANQSTALGNGKANGGGSFAFGGEANGPSSFSFGNTSQANGNHSRAMGYTSSANGTYSIAMGTGSEANSIFSTTLGYNTIANAYASTVVGMFNRPISIPQNTVYSSSPLFTVGNGSSIFVKSNAFQVRYDGSVEINDEYTLPTIDGSNNQVLTTDGSGNVSWQNSGSTEVFENVAGVIRNSGTNASDNLVFGAPTLDYDNISSHRSKMFFDKSKSAFRVGYVTNANWNTDSLGLYSIAAGSNSKATGDYSNAIGNNAKAYGYSSAALASYASASGNYSTVLGNGTDARGNTSTAMGSSTNANGAASTSIGLYSTANGEASTAIGDRAKANGYASTVVGRYNDTIVAVQTAVTNNTPLFIVGNGSSISNLSNAMVVRNDGKTGIGNTATNDRLLVYSNAGENALRVQISGQTKFRVFSNGSISMGTNNSGISSNDVYIHNDLGIGVSNPSERIHVSGNILASGTITSSDVRYKKDIQTIENSTEVLSKVKPVSYTFKTEEFENKFDNKKHLGVIAQDVEKIFPDMVYTDNDGYKAVNYTEFIPLLIQSNREQQAVISKQETEIKLLNKKFDKLYQMLLKIEIKD